MENKKMSTGELVGIIVTIIGLCTAVYFHLNTKIETKDDEHDKEILKLSERVSHIEGMLEIDSIKGRLEATQSTPAETH